MAAVSELDHALGVGDPAPDFLLPAVNRDGEIGLRDYKGRSPVLIGLFRGLHCPFCRRQIVQMNGLFDRLAALGTEGLAIINTELNRARLYYGRLNMRIALAVDPKWDTHRRYGLSRPKITLGKSQWPAKVNPMDVMALRINPEGVFDKPLSLLDANNALNEEEGFKRTLVDRKIQMLHGKTSAGFTLVDKDGIIRWRWIEAENDMQDIGKYPSDDEMLTAVSRGLGVT
jgi:peroxiredoxin